MSTLALPRRIDSHSSDEELFELLGEVGDAEPAREQACAVLVDRYQWLVHWAASRYQGRGEQTEVLEQVGYLGLMEAINRFDPHRGVDFVAYARPTVLGEIKRHFRDKRRWVRLPRRLQELKARLREATEALSQDSGHAPTVAELAEHLDLPEEEVNEAMATDDAFSPLSLDAPVSDSEEPATQLDLMGHEDDRLDSLIDIEALRPLLGELTPREQKMVLLRFYGNLTQSEIASYLGISQMHVSRLLNQTLNSLRAQLTSTN